MPHISVITLFRNTLTVTNKAIKTHWFEGHSFSSFYKINKSMVMKLCFKLIKTQNIWLTWLYSFKEISEIEKNKCCVSSD